VASKQITTFSIDQASGALTPLNPRVTTGDGPISITMDSQGRFAYVTNAIAGSVSVFAIDVASGTLTPRSTVSAGTNPVALMLDASGRFAYVANLGSDNVTHFAVDSNTGALTSVGLPINAGTGPAWLTLVK
jgi:6-phosphogluconolactonase